MGLEATMYSLALAIGLWMAFGSVNELHNANNSGGCCGSKCGEGFFDKITWWVTLLLAISFTLMVLYHGYEEMNKRGGLAAVRSRVGV